MDETEFRGIPLNKALLKGPHLLVSLPGVLSRFGEYQVFKYEFLRVIDRRCAFYGDHQEVPRPKQRSKWAYISYLFVLNRTAEDNKEAFRDVANLVKSISYVDNYLNSVNSEEVALPAAIATWS